MVEGGGMIWNGHRVVCVFDVSFTVKYICLPELVPLYSVTPRNVNSVSLISRVNLIVGWIWFIVSMYCSNSLVIPYYKDNNNYYLKSVDVIAG